MTNNDRILLVELPREVAKLIDGPPPSYRRFYVKVLDAVIPAERNDDGYWTVLSSDVPTIIATLGLRLKDAAPRAARASKREAASVTA